MYLVSKALEGADVPDSLPAGVETSAGGAGGSNAGATAASTGGSGAPDWVVSDSEKATYDGFFKSADKDKDGLVSGECWLWAAAATPAFLCPTHRPPPPDVPSQ